MAEHPKHQTIGRSGRVDRREVPSYTFTEAATYLLIPPSTLRAWTVGRHYRTLAERRFFEPVIELPERAPGAKPLLSFINLVEAHILSALRREHDVPLRAIRDSVKYLKKHYPSAKHPLIQHNFRTFEQDLFVEHFGQLINVSRDGQLAMQKILAAYLRRVERDQNGIPIRLYPFPSHRLDDRQPVVIDPSVSFGRPVLAGTGITTEVLAERYKAGETMEEIADDYGRERQEIEDAIRCAA